MSAFLPLMKKAMRCKCPKCDEGDLYQSGLLSVTLHNSCNACGMDWSKNNIADGPTIFLISILGIILVPLALVFENIFMPPLWAHAVVWSVAALFLTVWGLRPIKSYVIALQYKNSQAGLDG